MSSPLPSFCSFPDIFLPLNFALSLRCRDHVQVCRHRVRASRKAAQVIARLQNRRVMHQFYVKEHNTNAHGV